MLTVLLPLFIAVLGALMYGFASNGKVAEIGRILFFVGAFWCVHMVAAERVRF